MEYTESQRDAVNRFREKHGTEFPITGSTKYYYTPNQIAAINRFRKENKIEASETFYPMYEENRLSFADKKRLEERGRQMEDSLYRKK